MVLHTWYLVAVCENDKLCLLPINGWGWRHLFSARQCQRWRAVSCQQRVMQYLLGALHLPGLVLGFRAPALLSSYHLQMLAITTTL